MAQLSDDCFAFGGPMLSVAEAVGIIAARVTPVRETETVALVDADGRVLADDVAAPLPLPPFTNSAVDGYAVGLSPPAAATGPAVCDRRAGPGGHGRTSRAAWPCGADFHRCADA